MRAEKLAAEREAARVEWVRRQHAATSLQGLLRIRKAKARTENERQEKRRRQATLALQRVARGQAGRRSAAIVRAAVEEKRRAEQTRHFSALLIQSRWRGVLARQELRRRILRQMEAEAAAQRKKEFDAAVVIQCMVRMRLARKTKKKRKALRRALEEERRRMGRLERDLEKLQEEQEVQLMATRIQGCWRTKLARDRAAARRQEIADDLIAMEEKRIFDAAAKIQSMARGVATRLWFMRQMHTLKTRQSAARQIRAMKRHAEKHVQSIEDRMLYLEQFGATDELLRSLTAAQHPQSPQASTYGGELVPQDGSFFPQDESYYGSGVVDSYGQLGPEPSYATTVRSDWTQEWDANAGAYYWLNHATGEAAWTNPEEE